MALAIVLGGCVGSDPGGGAVEPVPEGFFGAVAGDEPRAVLVAREVLVKGGNASDAVIAYLFAATVTYPGAVSLASGGVCVAYDPVTNRAATIAFLPGRSGAQGATADRPTAVPGLPRGLYALSSRFGRFRFAQLIAPAESLARFGHPISRALAEDLALVGPPLFADSGIARIFAHRDGRPLAQGEDVVQLDLAATLSQIRARGVGEFYVGSLARRLSDGVAAMGGTLGFAELAAYTPQWLETAAVPFGYRLIHAPPPAVSSAIAALELFYVLESGDRYADADPRARAHLLAEAGLRIAADRPNWNAEEPAAALLATERLDALLADYGPDRVTPAATLASPPEPLTENPAATSVVAAGPDGSAAACVVTMNNLFGVGRMAPGLGVIMAAPPPSQPASLIPLIVVNHNTRQVVFVGAATGGVAAAPALATTMAEAMLLDRPLRAAIAAPRVVHLGNPDLVAVERGLDDSARQALGAAGREVREVPELGLVNAIYCSEGLEVNPESCVAAADPRGNGYAVGN